MDVLLNTCGRKRVQTVLFVFLLVVNAAAECPKPEGKESIILSEAALLMNDFPEGSDVTLECGNGFELDSGSGVITCIDGKWTEPDLICKKRDCGPPTPMPNMSFRLSEGTLFRAVAIVICDKGYRVIGSSYKQCFALGWSGRAKCEIITCSKPGGVTNGRSSWDSQDEPKYGETVQYVCDQGFSLTGNDSIMCTETGEYDAEPPKCEDMHGATDEISQDNGHLPVIISVICTATAVFLVLIFINKYIMRRKGFINGTLPICSRASVTPDRRADRL
ncbi:complement factor H isoform X4 [Labrus mixtus]|uniref:complement factor H isoform X4 n=1 Tax=Labrus mixtus TaxID=508554 RepID=UPI0029C099F6|nr:complement factor H isoform X4 [Labrus mixtus]